MIVPHAADSTASALQSTEENLVELTRQMIDDEKVAGQGGLREGERKRERGDCRGNCLTGRDVTFE